MQRKSNEKQYILRDLWGITKQNNMCITEIPGGEERVQGSESFFEEIMTEKYPKLRKDRDIKYK